MHQKPGTKPPIIWNVLDITEICSFQHNTRFWSSGWRGVIYDALRGSNAAAGLSHPDHSGYIHQSKMRRRRYMSVVRVILSYIIAADPRVLDIPMYQSFAANLFAGMVMGSLVVNEIFHPSKPYATLVAIGGSKEYIHLSNSYWPPPTVLIIHHSNCFIIARC